MPLLLGSDNRVLRTQECLPWAERACCASDTVETADKLKEGYGEEFHWDRCGPLSRACEAFFVQEACFYECEPTAGLYRKYQKHEFDPNNPDHNEWQMYGMPIKASYWDAWFAVRSFLSPLLALSLSLSFSGHLAQSLWCEVRARG
eukprot:2794709-Rhodomonas_salina.2